MGRLEDLFKRRMNNEELSYNENMELNQLLWKFYMKQNNEGIMIPDKCSHSHVQYGLFGKIIRCVNCGEEVNPNDITENTLIEQEEVDGDEWFWCERSYESFRSYFKHLGLLDKECD